jgi:hypothetical protein
MNKVILGEISSMALMILLQAFHGHGCFFHGFNTQDSRLGSLHRGKIGNIIKYSGGSN